MLPRLTLLVAASFALAMAEPVPAGGLQGRVEGDTYVSPTGEFRIPLPVLPELGGQVEDTANVVTFSDRTSTHLSIACFPLDASQRWELETRGLRDYLLFFFTEVVLLDFRQRFPGSTLEGARFLPELQDGSLITFALLPGGSSFEPPDPAPDHPPGSPATAKRGTLLFVRHQHLFVLSTELAERVTERSTYRQSTEAENTTLSARLTGLVGRLVFPAATNRLTPPAGAQ